MNNDIESPVLTQQQKLYLQDTALHPEDHVRFVQNFDEIISSASLHKKFVLEKVTNFCKSEEIEWIKDYKNHLDDGCAGLVFTSSAKENYKRIQGLAGWLLRNFIDVKVYSVHSLLDDLKSSKDFDPTVACIPNFYEYIENGKLLAPWETSKLLSWLYDRHTKEKLTIIYVDQLSKLSKHYGSSFISFIKDNYKIIKV